VSTRPAGLLATSVILAQEVNRPLGTLPWNVTVSVVTIGVLELGVPGAGDRGTRARPVERSRILP
jgi:hypothetical protein